MKKKFLSLLLAVTMAAGVFTGCGASAANAGGVFGKKEWTFSEYINSGETIWYETDGTAKDSEIETIYVIEPDGTMYYCPPEYCPSMSSQPTMEDFEQMEDEDIISEVKKGHEAYFSENPFAYSEHINHIYLAPLLEPYLDDIKPAQYELVIETDSTGNNTAKETLYYQQPVPRGEGVDHTLRYRVDFKELNIAFDTYNIYDSWYGGYRLDTDPTYFLTRVGSEDVSISLDPPGTENVRIDDTHSFNTDPATDPVSEREWEEMHDND